MDIQPFTLERYFAQYEFKAPYLLCTSDCEAMTVRELLALEPGSAEGLQECWLGYTESQGSPELRTEIADLYETLDADDILVHAGAEEAIFNFMNAVLTPSDHVIVHSPCYQSLYEVAHAAGCQVSRWLTSEAEDWALDLEWLEEHIQPNTKAIVVNCPHNPTGYLMSHQTQQQLIEIARRHNLLLFSDEVYRGLEYRLEDRLPAASDLYENGISLGVMSKTYGLAGLRIGWIATRNRAIYEAMAAFKDYTTICNSAPSEYLATLALRQKAPIVQRNVEIATHNLALLNQFFDRYAAIFSWVPPKAGAIAFPGLKIDQSIEQFCADLVEQAGVLLLPGTKYDFDDRHFRVGFGRKNMPEALERLEAYLGDQGIV
ncbi:MAG: aminotransferase class I/II-fold pyridoxal phosphate-dependent enzyme [Anaerolineae bacterium]|nr:aminotransferase class I/II-fold pyridoxal phosphate-dependent enzyme [Anaerolineae bacterium]